jgi:hypothetical protein
MCPAFFKLIPRSEIPSPPKDSQWETTTTTKTHSTEREEEE